MSDADQLLAHRDELVSEPGALRAKRQAGLSRQLSVIQGHGTGQIVHADDDIAIEPDLFGEVSDRGMVRDAEIAVGDHRSSAVPASPADDVYARDIEGVCGPHDRADVEVVFPVLDRYPQWVSPCLKIGNDGLNRPVAIAIDDIPAIAVRKELGIKPGVLRPRLGMRSDTRCPGGLRHLFIVQETHSLRRYRFAT